MPGSSRIVFVDTEFAALSSPPRPISVSLVADTGQAFYAELEEGSSWSRDECSGFVVDVVLPLLDDEPVTPSACVSGMAAWIARERLSDAIFCSDAPLWDEEALVAVHRSAGVAYTLSPLWLMSWEEEGVDAAVSSLHEDGSPKHHALADARNMRRVWAAGRAEISPRRLFPSVGGYP